LARRLSRPVRAVLGIDLGTTYFKAGLFSEDGQLLGMGRAVVAAQTNAGGRLEISPSRFQSLLGEVVGRALAESGLPSVAVEAVSYSSQANSFLLLDQDERPLTPIILWPDRRVEEIPPELSSVHSRPDFSTVTGLDLVSPFQCASKLLWLRDREPEVWRRMRMVMTVSDYFTYLMTGERAGDSGTASLLGLWNLPAGEWWKEGIAALGLLPTAFSRLCPPGTVVGRTTQRAADFLGVPPGIPFAVGSLDHHLAAIGSGVGPAVSVMESTGTVIACFAESAQFAPRRRCAMGPGVSGGAPFYSLAFHDSGAVVLEWYRNHYAADLSFDELTGLAERVPVGSDGLTCLPFANTYSDKQGFLSPGSQWPQYGRGHFARAIMESIAGELSLLLVQLRDNLPQRVLSTGGAAQSRLWLRIKADLTGCAMVTSGFPEAACAGAAMLAASAAGWFTTPIQASASWVKMEEPILPDAEAHRAYKDWFERYLRLRPPG
jgi:xylulokinase